MTNNLEASSKGITIIDSTHLGEEAFIFLKEKLKEVFKEEVFISKKRLKLEHSFDPLRKQYNSSSILERLREQFSSFYRKVLILVDVDLYVTGLNFVFGQADPYRGIAIVSLARLDPRFYNQEFNLKLLRLRILKEIVHEIGHLYGLGHCYNFRCVMYFSNSLLDTDRKDYHFCKICQKRLDSFKKNAH